MDLLDLEQQRLALEENLQKLRQRLKHWQTWEAEYEGLKEEILNASPGSITTPSQLETIANTYDGDLVDGKEIRELTGLDKDSPRGAKQIIGLIERRQEYVQKNIETAQRQFFEAEAKSEELAFAVAREGSAGNGAGLPLTEIHEELDEEGNVISSHLSQPEESTTEIVQSLRKAGLSEADLKRASEPKLRTEDLKPAITNASPTLSTTSITQDKRVRIEPAVASPVSDASQEDLERPSSRKKSVSFSADTKAAAERPRPESEDGKKTVSFNDKIAVMPAAPPPDNRSVSFSTKVEEIPPPASPDLAATAGDEIASVRDAVNPNGDSTQAGDDFSTNDDVVIPEDESPEDARLRREMLEYHLNEVGNVVAQIDLDDATMNIDPDDYDEDDSSSYHTTSEYLDDEDTPYTTGQSEDEDSEDEYGRSKCSQITPEYRKQMEELHNKLIGNLGPAPKDDEIADADPEINPKDVRKLVIREKRNSTSSASSESSEKRPGSKKRVSFAESLDVADPGSPPFKAQKLSEAENAVPVVDTISERSTATSHSLPRRLSNDGVSQFKKLRAAPITGTDSPAEADCDLDMEDAPVIGEPTPPTDAIMSTNLKERMPARPTTSAPSLDDPGAVAQRRELAAEYYRRRNDMIKQQGGFKSTDEEEEELGGLMEEKDGKVKKVSRFMAARLKS
jgi:unconventional prefoldin RPB5 interactor 1